MGMEFGQHDHVHVDSDLHFAYVIEYHHVAPVLFVVVILVVVLVVVVAVDDAALSVDDVV